MGRIGLIALTVVVTLSSQVRADANFAAQEFDRYFKAIHPDLRATVKFSVDPALGNGGEACSMTSDPESMHVVGNNDFMVLRGCYALLDMLGCRFLAPKFSYYDGSAEIMKPHELVMMHFDHPLVLKPKLRFRKLYVEEGHSHTPENLAQIVEWMPKVGYNTLVVPLNYGGRGRVQWDDFREKVAPECQKRGIAIEVGGHGYQNFLNAEMEGGKLFEQHPEWFGQDETGQRTKAENRVLCTSTPAAVAFLIANFLAYLKDRPEIQIFDFWPPDGAKWCTCDACAKLGEPPDRQAILLRQVKEKLKPVRPDVRLEAIAYSSYVDPPANQEVDKNILIDFCPINQQFDYQINGPSAEKNKAYVDALTAWRKKFAGDISIYSYYRKYAWDSLPVIIPHYMQTDLQWYAALPVQGVSSYAEPGDWGTYELNHYVLAALAWDPNAAVDELIAKFCEARYGAEAATGREALLMLERLTRNYCSVPHTTMKSAEEIAKAQKQAEGVLESITTAEKRASDPAVKSALVRLQLMYTYVIRDLEIQQLRATSAPREQVVEKATVLHGWVADHDDDGVFLINGNRLNLNRMLSRYGVGERKRPAATAGE